MAGNVVIYHNPACGTSRNALAMIRATGAEPIVIEYLNRPPSRVELQDLVRRRASHCAPSCAIWGTPFAELGLDKPALSDSALLDSIEQSPILIIGRSSSGLGGPPVPTDRNGA